MLEDLMRPHILTLESYTSARDDFSGSADVYLDANENWMDFSGDGKNRYPDPHCTALRRKIEEVLGFKMENTVLGNGSDELIDMLIRLFADPGKDCIMIERPTYGEYKVFAEINNVRVVNVMLSEDLDLDVKAIKREIDNSRPKILFICSPNNPTGKSFSISKIREIADYNPAITVVDEAYADFDRSFVSAYSLLEQNERIVVLRTFSKYWALASSRIGILVASQPIIRAINKIKAPYNLSISAQRDGLKALEEREQRKAILSDLLNERARLYKALSAFSFVRWVYPSDANFILIKVDDADGLYAYLMKEGIIVRNRSREPLLDNTLRITVGSKAENDALLEALSEREKSLIS